MEANECEHPDGHDKKRRKIDFTVDREPLTAWSESHSAELTVKEILDLSGNQPAEQYYLVEFTGEGHKHREKYEKLDELLHVKEHARFAAIYSGCTPVSEMGREVLLGAKRLKAELEAIGVACEGPLNSGGLEWLLLHDYPAPGGRCSGQAIHLAVAVPADFPQTPPGGIYVSPKVIPEREMGGLNIHHRPNETGGLPGDWQYWSRPIPPGTWTAPADESAFQERKLKLAARLRLKVRQEVVSNEDAALAATSGTDAARLHAQAGQVLSLYPMSQEPAVLNEAKELASRQSDVATRIELIRRQHYNQWACDRIASAFDDYHKASSLFHPTKAKQDESDAIVRNLGEVDPYLLEPAVVELYTSAIELTKGDLSEQEKVQLARRLTDPSLHRKNLGDF